MTCKERRDRLYDRLYGLLDEADAAELDRHLGGCADCAREMETLRQRDALLDQWTPEYRAAGPVRVASPRRLPAWAVAAAALVVVTLTTILFPAGDRYALTSGSATSGKQVLSKGSPLRPGMKLQALERASILLGAAGRLEMEPKTELAYRNGGPGSDHDLDLVEGTVHVEVHPTGKAFRVRIGERTVEVRGTRFTVRRLNEKDLGAVLGEESMKRWNPAAVAVALVTVTSGSVVLIGPDGRHPIEAGRTLLATPAGVEKVGAAESLDSTRQVRDELLRTLAIQELKTRAARGELDALRAKYRKGVLPPGATLQSLLAGLRAALDKGDAKEIEEALGLLDLLLEKDPAAFDGMLQEILGTKDARYASLLCSALGWRDGAKRLSARRADVVKLVLAPGLPVDVRHSVVQSLWSFLSGPAGLEDAESAAVLRLAQAMKGATGEADDLRTLLTSLVCQRMNAPSESWTEFQKLIGSDVGDRFRRSALQQFFWQRKASAEAEGLLFDALRGRYGAVVAADRLTQPLLPWFHPGNAEAFAGVLRQTALQLSEPDQRLSVAGQLGLLHLIQRNPGARHALSQIHADERDPDARAKMGEVLEALDQGTLDLDKLMDKLKLRWNF